MALDVTSTLVGAALPAVGAAFQTIVVAIRDAMARKHHVEDRSYVEQREDSLRYRKESKEAADRLRSVTADYLVACMNFAPARWHSKIAESELTATVQRTTVDSEVSKVARANLDSWLRQASDVRDQMFRGHELLCLLGSKDVEMAASTLTNCMVAQSDMNGRRSVPQTLYESSTFARASLVASVKEQITSLGSRKNSIIGGDASESDLATTPE